MALFTLMSKAPPRRATVPVAVGLTTMVMVGSGKAALGVTVVGCLMAPEAVIEVEGSGDPLGLTVPTAPTVLFGVIVAVARSWLSAAAGCLTSQVTVTVALGVMVPAGVFSSIWKGTVAVGAPDGPQV
ncbi:hypothetical protein E1292_09950 [Nonomuraea deserti]|uniref:Uncharacterized protein n=1 Tax=Nonomuraea deserti TaxID=1848322 RepID=A0A4R4VTX6_9ACTN|nr:hypothetical protein [Nonomuraea deserti]TDD09392.1 hypothetical protein E1292_09950 [Nonomuraea deserti]